MGEWEGEMRVISFERVDMCATSLGIKMAATQEEFTWTCTKIEILDYHRASDADVNMMGTSSRTPVFQEELAWTLTD